MFFLLRIIAIILPAFWSYKALRNGREDHQINLLKHWVVLVSFLFLESIVDKIFFWFPVWHIFKFIVLYRITFKDLATRTYDRFIEPVLHAREQALEYWSQKLRSLTSTFDVASKMRHVIAHFWQMLHPCCHSYAAQNNYNYNPSCTCGCNCTSNTSANPDVHARTSPATAPAPQESPQPEPTQTQEKEATDGETVNNPTAPVYPPWACPDCYQQFQMHLNTHQHAH